MFAFNRPIMAVIAVYWLLGSAAAANTQKSIVGTWHDDESGETLTFTPDAKFSGTLDNRYTTAARRDVLKGTYFVAGDKLSIHITRQYGGTEDLSCAFQFLPDGDLVLTYLNGGMYKEDNSMRKYRRAQGGASVEAKATKALLACSPSVLHNKNKLLMTMPREHGKELGVKTPSGRLLFIAFRPESAACKPPLLSSAFVSMTRLELDTDAAVGLRMICDGETTRIFSERGTYEFVVSPNLETEDTPANIRCKVQFVP